MGIIEKILPVKYLKIFWRRLCRIVKMMKFRLFFIFFIIGIIPVGIFGQLIQSIVKDEMASAKMNRLLNQCNILENHISSENYMEKPDSESVNAEMEQLSSMYDGRVMIINKDLNIVKDTYNMDEGKTCVSREVIQAYRGKTINKYTASKGYIEIVLPISDYENRIQGVLYVTFSTKDVENSVSTIKDNMIIIYIIINLVIFLISLIMSIIFIKPLDKLKEAFGKRSDDFLDDKIELKMYTEIEDMCQSYNSMLDKMNSIETSRKEFVSNVSHELKTPIASMKVLADSLLMQEDVPSEIYKEFMTDIASEVDRENDIINNLLELVKLNKKNDTLNISQVNINELVEIILKRLRPIAAKKNVEIVLESFRPVIAEVDEIKINSVVTNLVENAVKYNVMDGWVRVSINADHAFFYIKVADSGVGIPEESQEFIFDRFYRVDKARARQTGGTGLGLAIAKNIVLLHNGMIKVYSKEGEGTTFTVRIPLNYINTVNIEKEADENEK